MEKEKLSIYLVNKGFFTTRSQAHNAIKSYLVTVNGRTITKDGYMVDDNDSIVVDQSASKYVSRGGYKLERAIEFFNIDLTDKIVLDIGASTGGFTDCCLQNNAKKVYAFDVGHGQLAEKLRNDNRVIVKEGINARYLNKNDFNEDIDFICMDVSFISCEKILPAIADILDDNKKAVILYKPQFEVGKQYLNNKGVCTNEKIVIEKLKDCQKIANTLKLSIEGYIPSPIKGQDGNQEYLLYIVKNGTRSITIEELKC